MKLYQKLEFLQNLYDIAFTDGANLKTPYQTKAEKIAEKLYKPVIIEKLATIKKIVGKELFDKLDPVDLKGLQTVFFVNTNDEEFLIDLEKMTFKKVEDEQE